MGRATSRSFRAPRLQRTWRASLTRAAAVIVLLGSAVPGQAQTPSPLSWRNGAYALTANVAIGAATSLARSILMGRRDRATPAFWGAVGGAVVFAGKAIPPETQSLQGLAGFGLSAIGVSIVANAADGLAPLARVTVPLGPLRLRVVSGDGPTFQFALNAHDAIVLAKRLQNPDLRFDLRENTDERHGVVSRSTSPDNLWHSADGRRCHGRISRGHERVRGRSRWRLGTRTGACAPAVVHVRELDQAAGRRPPRSCGCPSLDPAMARSRGRNAIPAGTGNASSRLRHRSPLPSARVRSQLVRAALTPISTLSAPFGTLSQTAGEGGRKLESRQAHRLGNSGNRRLPHNRLCRRGSVPQSKPLRPTSRGDAENNTGCTTPAPSATPRATSL